MENKTMVDKKEHITSGADCWCNPTIEIMNDAKIIIHNYEESSGEFYKRMGVDGALWAQELHKQLEGMSLNILQSWCCNMIMAGYDKGIEAQEAEMQLLKVVISELHDLALLKITDYEEYRVYDDAQAALNKTGE